MTCTFTILPTLAVARVHLAKAERWWYVRGNWRMARAFADRAWQFISAVGLSDDEVDPEDRIVLELARRYVDIDNDLRHAAWLSSTSLTRQLTSTDLPMVRKPDFQSGNRGFDSPSVHHVGDEK